MSLTTRFRLASHRTRGWVRPVIMSASLTRSVPVTRPSPNISPKTMWPHTRRPCSRRRDESTDMSRRAGGISRLGQAVARGCRSRAARKTPSPRPQPSRPRRAGARGSDRRRFRRCEPRKNRAGHADRRIGGQNAGGADLEQPAEIRDGVDQRGARRRGRRRRAAGRSPACTAQRRRAARRRLRATLRD